MLGFGEESTFDDGTTIVYSASGDPVAAQSSGAGAPTTFGAGVTQQFSDLFNFGARRWLDAELAPSRPAVAPGASAPGVPRTTATGIAGYLKSPLVLALGLGLAGLVAYKFFKG